MSSPTADGIAKSHGKSGGWNAVADGGPLLPNTSAPCITELNGSLKPRPWTSPFATEWNQTSSPKPFGTSAASA